MMNHAIGWMNGWVGAGMWVWPVFGVLVLFLLIAGIVRASTR